MGSSSSKTSTSPRLRYATSHSRRAQTTPRPEPAQFEREWTEFIQSMDIAPDRVRAMDSWDDDKKWEILLDWVRAPSVRGGPCFNSGGYRKCLVIM